MNDWKNFRYENESFLIFRTLESYTRTASGANWKSKPDTVKNEIISPEFYTNYISAIPFFNNWGDGAYCRAKSSYNMPGYLPTHVVTVSPFRQKKEIADFWFFKKEILLLNAGYREGEIVENAKRFKTERIDGHNLIYFYTDNNDDTASGIFDTKTNFWRG